MSFLSRLSSLFALKQKTAVKLIAIMSVFAFVINLTPELYRDVASQASEESGEVTAAAPPSPPTNTYLLVTQDGNANPTQLTGCQIRLASSPYPTPELSPQNGLCNLAQAINQINALSALANNVPLSVVFSEQLVNTAGTAFISDHTVRITANLPTILSAESTVRFVFDGVYGSNQKYILQDASTGRNNLDYFFRIGTQKSTDEQQVLIRNFAFAGLKKAGAAAITTDNPATAATGSYPGFPTVQPLRNVDGSRLRTLHIRSNYFGTTDGETLNAQNEVFQGIRIFTTEEVTDPDIQISDNNFYNTGLPIQIGTTDSNSGNNCELTIETSGILINDNIIGLDKNKRIGVTPSGSTLPEGGWNIYAISICNLNNVDIDRNTIANSIGLVIDTGIVASQTNAEITNNALGVSTNSDLELESANANQAIYGYGIVLIGNFPETSDTLDQSSVISNNLISNIKLLDIPQVFSQFIYCPTLFQNRYDYTRSNGKNCGGTAIRLEGSSNNIITKNKTAALDSISTLTTFSNDGYGIELEGISIPAATTGTDITLTSANNKIVNNLLAFNKADAIMVAAIDRYTTIPALDPVDRICESGSIYTNNCDNSIFQNAIFRNGAYNANSFGLSNSHEGGIGIDLKQVTESEQKYGTSFYAGSGTTNDTDISINDSGDTDNGANSMLNFPVINGTGALSTSSTSYNIQGQLPMNANGTYWVEVFRVACPSAITLPSPTVTETNSYAICDTDARNIQEQTDKLTYGQGALFLCGTLVNKTGSSGNWSCRPRDFGNDFNGGLVTTTVTEVNTPTGRSDYGINLAWNELVGLAKFSCALANIYYSAIPTETCGTGGVVGPEGLYDGNGLITKGLGSTSEFSANVYIDPPSLSIAKSVRSCTSSTPDSCSGEFVAEINRDATQVGEFRIDILNNTSSTSEINLVDVLPSNMSWVSNSCAYFNNQITIATTRPSTGAVTCTPGGQNLTVSLPTSGGVESNKHLTIFVLARVNAGVSSATITNTAVVSTTGAVCNVSSPVRCDASARILVGVIYNANLVKTIQSPDTNSNLDSETLNSPTSQTTVNYQIRVTLTGVTKANVGSLIITDNFPKTISTTQQVDYSTSNCQFTIQRNSGTATTPQNCANLSTINSTNIADLAIWNGASIDTAFPTFTATDTFVITITYRGLVPANPLLSTDPQATVTNTAKFIGTGFTTQTDNTTLTITPPNSTPVIPTFRKQVRSCTGTTADTCTGAFNETGLSNVAPGSTVEFRFEATSSSGATFAFRDPAPTGITFATSANSCLAYAGIAQLSGTAARPTTGSSPCTFDATSGTQVLNTSNVTIAANQYAYVYALATISSTATGTITNTAGLNGNGCSTTVAQCNDPATITITSTTPGQVSIDKQVNPTAVTSSATTQDVTYTIVLTKPNTFAINNANWTDTFPTTPVALSNYTCTSVSVLPAGSQTIACPTTFPPAGNTLFTGTINAAVTSITMTYTARVPANAAPTTAQSVVNSTSITGARSTDAVAISQTDTATLTVNPANASGTPVVSLSKRADNGVTTSDRSTEKIYKPGDTVNYTLSMLNSGASAATGVSLQDLFHSMLKSMTINALPAGATQSLTTTAFNFGNITVPTGTTPTTVTYHGTIANNDNFDLDLFDLDEGSNPARDDDFYASKDADIDDDLGTSNNSHRRAEDILGAPDNKFVSLGSDGEMTIDLGTKVIVNGSGDDFALRTINQSVDDTDQAGEDLKVSVSQDGTTFKTINPRSSDGNRYDLSKARMSWVRYIRLQDESANVQAKAPGTDIDAICLLNIGVQLPNRVNMTIGSQSAFATEYVTVDVTKVFDKKPSANNCDEPEPVVVQEQLPPAPPAPLPPAPVYIPTPPPALPKTGAEPLVLVSLVSSLAWVFTRKKK
jgi:hypothetical protein